MVVNLGEVVVPGEWVCTHVTLQDRVLSKHLGGSTGFGQETEAGAAGSPSQSLYQGLCRGGLKSLGLATSYNSGGLWDIGAVSSCLVSGPG